MWYEPQQPCKTHKKCTESQLSMTVANRRKRAYTSANIEAFGQVSIQIQSIPKLNVGGLNAGDSRSGRCRSVCHR